MTMTMFLFHKAYMCRRTEAMPSAMHHTTPCGLTEVLRGAAVLLPRPEAGLSVQGQKPECLGQKPISYSARSLSRPEAN